MKIKTLAAAGVAMLALALAACGSSSSKGQGTPSMSPAPPTLGVSQTDLGSVVADNQGRTAYVFTMDKPNSGMSACYGDCAKFWPPVTVTGTPKADGVTGALGTIKRTDGSTQVTLNGYPLYLYAGDMQHADVKGQDVNMLWYVVKADGSVLKPAQPATLRTNYTDLGQVVTDSQGRTAYIYTQDKPNSGMSTCYNQCATYWPPVLASGTPTWTGVTGTVGTIRRTDGSMQVTLNGYPLYLYAQDMKPSDVKGQDVNKVWYVIGADGTPMLKK